MSDSTSPSSGESGLDSHQFTKWWCDEGSFRPYDGPLQSIQQRVDHACLFWLSCTIVARTVHEIREYSLDPLWRGKCLLASRASALAIVTDKISRRVAGMFRDEASHVWILCLPNVLICNPYVYESKSRRIGLVTASKRDGRFVCKTVRERSGWAGSYPV